MTQLPAAYKQASEIADKAQILSETLRDMALEGVQAQGIDPFIFAITIFTLACCVGYYVVWKVTPALHTPLMSITNAISGIIIIGGMIAATPEQFSIASVCGYLAVFLAAINIFGGFIVTGRMLEMFRKK
jgi:NAD(P) transhydrogenase subunit alpha